MSTIGQKLSKFYQKPVVNGAAHLLANLIPGNFAAQQGIRLADYMTKSKVSPSGNMNGLYGQNPEKTANYAYPQTAPQPQVSAPVDTAQYSYAQIQPPVSSSQSYSSSQNMNSQDDGFTSALAKINKQFALPQGPYDVNQYVTDYNKGVNPGETELLSEYDKLNNRRNDIYVGATDPYGVGAQSGKALNPSQLSSIEQGMGKTYDPALSDVKARLLHAQNMEERNAKSSGGGNMNQQIDNERALINLFRQDESVKLYNNSKNAYDLITSLDPNTNNPSLQQSLIVEYAKLLDPGSVVRESEFELTKKYSQSKLNQIKNEITHALNGTGVLSPDAIKAIQDATKIKMNSTIKNYNQAKDYYTQQATRWQMDPKIITGYKPEDGTGQMSLQTSNYIPVQNPYAGKDYMSYYDYNTDLQLAKDSIARGKSSAENAMNMLKKKYRDVNPNDLSFNNVGSGTNRAPKVVAGYDISSYATDPNHERSVATIYQRTPQFNTPADIDKVIRSVAPRSPITGQMIATAANTYGVDPKMVYAMILQDSSLGTAGMGARNNNPGNIGQYDNLNRPVAGYQTLQGGVNAVAKWLSKKKVNQPNQNYA